MYFQKNDLYAAIFVKIATFLISLQYNAAAHLEIVNNGCYVTIAAIVFIHNNSY